MAARFQRFHRILQLARSPVFELEVISEAVAPHVNEAADSDLGGAEHHVDCVGKLARERDQVLNVVVEGGGEVFQNVEVKVDVRHQLAVQGDAVHDVRRPLLVSRLEDAAFGACGRWSVHIPRHVCLASLPAGDAGVALRRDRCACFVAARKRPRQLAARRVRRGCAAVNSPDVLRRVPLAWVVRAGDFPSSQIRVGHAAARCDSCLACCAGVIARGSRAIGRLGEDAAEPRILAKVSRSNPVAISVRACFGVTRITRIGGQHCVTLCPGLQCGHRGTSVDVRLRTSIAGAFSGGCSGVIGPWEQPTAAVVCPLHNAPCWAGFGALCWFVRGARDVSSTWVHRAGFQRRKDRAGVTRLVACLHFRLEDEPSTRQQVGHGHSVDFGVVRAEREVDLVAA